MARIYAGILGLLAFASVVARSLIHSSAGGEAIWQAITMLLAFAAIGFVIGLAGQWIIDDSVRDRLTGGLQSKPASAAAKNAANESATSQ